VLEMGEAAGKGDARGASKAEQELTEGEDDVCAEKKGEDDPPPPPTPHPPLSERAVNDPFTSRPWFTSRPVTSRPGSRRDPLTSTRFTVRPVHVGSRCDPLHFDDSKDKKICLAILMFRRYSEEEF
jgi:hypothetical protein